MVSFFQTLLLLHYRVWNNLVLRTVFPAPLCTWDKSFIIPDYQSEGLCWGNHFRNKTYLCISRDLCLISAYISWKDEAPADWYHCCWKNSPFTQCEVNIISKLTLIVWSYKWFVLCGLWRLNLMASLQQLLIFALVLALLHKQNLKIQGVKDFHEKKNLLLKSLLNSKTLWATGKWGPISRRLPL